MSAFNFVPSYHSGLFSLIRILTTKRLFLQEISLKVSRSFYYKVKIRLNFCNFAVYQCTKSCGRKVLKKTFSKHKNRKIFYQNIQIDIYKIKNSNSFFKYYGIFISNLTNLVRFKYLGV